MASSVKRSYKQEELQNRIKDLEDAAKVFMSTGANMEKVLKIYQQKQELEKKLRKIKAAQLRQRRHRDRKVADSLLEDSASVSPCVSPTFSCVSTEISAKQSEVVDFSAILFASEDDFLRHVQSLLTSRCPQSQIQQLVSYRIQFVSDALQFGVDNAQIFYKLKSQLNGSGVSSVLSPLSALTRSA
jgi:hypothetical protein